MNMKRICAVISVSLLAATNLLAQEANGSKPTESLLIEIVYEGIDQATQAEVREEWRKQKIDLSQGSEYDAVKVKRAAAIIKDLLVRRGNQRAKVSPMVEQQ